MSRTRKDLFLGLSIAAVTVLLIMILAGIRQSRSDMVEISGDGEKIAVVELFGPIYDSRRIVRQMENYAEMRSIKAILLRIDSPGGGVAPSQEIYEAVRRVRDDGKPVVVSMGSVAASGGYYAACGADSIMASPGTTTGSIGVYAEFMNTEELFAKIGIKFEMIKSGRYKDSGSPHRPMNEQDRAYLQGWIDDAYEQFVDVVMRERSFNRRQVRKVADGRVFTGRQALEVGLVDTLGYYADAIDLAAAMAGIDGDPTLVKERVRRASIFDLFFEQITGVLRGFRSGMRLKYQYM